MWLFSPWSTCRSRSTSEGSKRRFRPCLETLEDRTVPDATIGIEGMGGGRTLTIQGTAQSEIFHVARVTSPEQGTVIEVTALEHEGRPTTFNGGNTSQRFSGTFYHINARLGAGHDHLMLQELRTPRYGGGYYGGRLTISAGTGDDLVELRGLSINGPTEVNLGGGRDVIAVENTTFRLSTSFQGSGGHDVFADLGGNRFPGRHELLGFEQVQPDQSAAQYGDRHEIALSGSGHPEQLEVIPLSDGAILETLAINDGVSSLGTWQGRAVIFVTPDGNQTFGVLRMHFANGDTLLLALRNEWVQNEEHPNGAFLGTYRVLAGTGGLAGACGRGSADVLFLGEQGEEVLFKLRGNVVH